uniref:Potassium channel domain-containing protein n=1 Tax=Onchocerca volvulus TaxID=6282 RepID=A0A8R1Y112_ONCVO
MNHYGYLRVDSDPMLSSELTNSKYSRYNYSGDGELGPYNPNLSNDSEQYELDDHVDEMSQTYTRHASRKEKLYQERLSQCSATMDQQKWNKRDLLDVPDKTCIDVSSTSEGPTMRDTSEDDEFDHESGIKKYAKLILPHVGLVLLTCAYTFVGASVFYSVEQPHELASKRRQLDMIYERQEEFVNSLFTLAMLNETRREVWSQVTKQHMHNMSDHLFNAFEKFFLTAAEVRANDTIEMWSFSTSIFFAVTVVTTIGYGNPVPVTQLGRMMCIIFSLFGIPLTLVTIADIGKFLSEHLVWMYGNYLKLKHFLWQRHHWHKGHKERVCEQCQRQGLSADMHFIEEQRIPAMLVLVILVAYTSLGGVLMSNLEPWNFFTAFYWSFITMTTVGFGDLMPRRDGYMYLILLYIILGLAITTMCIDLVGVQYIRKIHYFGRKIQDARSALAVVGGKVVLVSELYANLMQKRAKSCDQNTFIIDNFHISKHVIPFIPADIRWIRYIDQNAESLSSSSLTSTLDLHSCRFCHSRFSISRYHP